MPSFGQGCARVCPTEGSGLITAGASWVQLCRIWAQCHTAGHCGHSQPWSNSGITELFRTTGKNQHMGSPGLQCGCQGSLSLGISYQVGRLRTSFCFLRQKAAEISGLQELGVEERIRACKTPD